MAPRKKVGIPNTQIGSTKKIGRSLSDMTKSYYERRRLLKIPQNIIDENPDKRFYFINMNKFEKNGRWHHNGYQLFRANDDQDSIPKDKFSTPLDPYLHRGEMALAWIPKEEYEMRQLERDIVKGKRDLSDIINNNSDLNALHFAPHSTSTTEVLEYTRKQQADTVVNLGV